MNLCGFGLGLRGFDWFSRSQLGARQKQAKQNLVGQRGALDVARAQAEAHARGVGDDQAQAAPARNETVLLGKRGSKIFFYYADRLWSAGAAILPWQRRNLSPPIAQSFPI